MKYWLGCLVLVLSACASGTRTIESTTTVPDSGSSSSTSTSVSATTSTSTSSPDLEDGWGSVEIDGEPLPRLTDNSGVNDDAVGLTVATVSGGDWKGNAFSIAPDGRPKVVLFLAHWCPHCQAEVPEVQAWIDSGNSPRDVDLYSITSFTDPGRALWPPQVWLIGEGWTVPVIMDDGDSSVAFHYGVSATPTYVVLDGQNRVVWRVAGQIGTSGLEQLIQLARESASA